MNENPCLSANQQSPPVYIMFAFESPTYKQKAESEPRGAAGPGELEPADRRGLQDDKQGSAESRKSEGAAAGAGVAAEQQTSGRP